MTNKRKKGFTLVELMVVLVILGIIAAIAVPLFINYWKKAEFRKNEENAKTVYLAAESRLTYYRSSGQWEQLQRDSGCGEGHRQRDRTESCVQRQ